MHGLIRGCSLERDAKGEIVQWEYHSGTLLVIREDRGETMAVISLEYYLELLKQLQETE